MLQHIFESWALMIALGYVLIAWAYAAECRKNVAFVDTQLRKTGLVRRRGESDEDALERVAAELEFSRQGCYDATVVDHR